MRTSHGKLHSVWASYPSCSHNFIRSSLNESPLLSGRNATNAMQNRYLRLCLSDMRHKRFHWATAAWVAWQRAFAISAEECLRRSIGLGISDAMVSVHKYFTKHQLFRKWSARAFCQAMSFSCRFQCAHTNKCCQNSPIKGFFFTAFGAFSLWRCHC